MLHNAYFDKGVSMLHNKFYCLFFFILIFAQIICTSFQNQINFARDIQYFLTADDNDPKIQEEFTQFLTQHPEVITTTDQRNTHYFYQGQTLAHLCAAHCKLILLALLLKAGETADSPVMGSRPGFEKCVGATAFLTLCFQLKKISTDNLFQKKLFLALLKNFAERSSHVVDMKRVDHITPAMALICTGLDSGILHEALSILGKYHAKAFDGQTASYHRTHPGEQHSPATVLSLLFKGVPTTDSCNALHMVLLKQKDQNPLMFKEETTKFARYCSSIGGKNEYLRIILNLMPPEEQLSQELLNNTNQIADPRRQENKRQILQLCWGAHRTTEENGCLCCQNQCYCCKNPNIELSHNPFWEDFYTKNPQHPNAAAWQQAYQSLKNSV